MLGVAVGLTGLRGAATLDQVQSSRVREGEARRLRWGGDRGVGFTVFSPKLDAL